MTGGKCLAEAAIGFSSEENALMLAMAQIFCGYLAAVSSEMAPP